MIKSMDFIGEDSRVRKYVMPGAVLYKSGNIQGEAALFTKKDVQITTNEADCFIMENTGGAKSGILLDFGVELAGSIKLLTYRAIGEAPVSIRLRFGESAAEALSEIGERNSTNDHSSRDFVVDLVSFSDMEFGQTGFRFVSVTLLTPLARLEIKSILAVLVYRDIEYQGSFESDNAVLNNIFDTCAYTCHLNMQSMLWDGIKRDRLVWIGDMHPEMLTIRTVFGYDPCIERGLEFSANQFPLPRFANDMITYSMWWIIIARDWRFYSDSKEFIRKHKAYIMELLECLLTYVNEDGSDNLSAFGDMGYFLDWPTLGSEDAIYGARALFAIALEKGGQLCGDLGENAFMLQAKCKNAAAALKKREVPTLSKKACIAFASLAGHMDREIAAKMLASGGAEGLSTFMSYYILTALANGGKQQEAFDIMLEYYGGMLELGATTFFEDFNLDWKKEGAHITSLCQNGEYNFHGETGAHCYVGYRHSLCHGWSSAPTAFIMENILGIKAREAGYKKVSIKPNLLTLKFAKGRIPTPYGAISVDCSYNSEGELVTKIDAPKSIVIVEE